MNDVLNISDTEIEPELIVKKSYNKKPVFTENELDQLTFLSKFDKVEEDLNNLIEVIKKIKNQNKELKQAYQHDIAKIKKMKKHKQNSEKTGLNKKFILSNKLCKLVNVDNGSEFSIPEFTKLICNELKKRKLVYEKDKRIFRVDSEFSDILKINKSVNNSINYPDKNGFNIGTMQTYISEAIKN